MSKVNLDQVKSALAEITGPNPKSERILTEYALAFDNPLRKGLMSGNTVNGIYTPMDFSKSRLVVFELDIVRPGTEKDYAAWVSPNCGMIPQRAVESDYVTVPTYTISNAIDWCLKQERDSGYNLVERALEVYRQGFDVKLNTDGWHVILAAAASRGLVVLDSAAPGGYMTKRLFSIAKIVMRRNGGGNSASVNRSRLTDVFTSPEGVENMRNWSVDQVDEVTRREIYLANDDTISRVFGVNIHATDEFGVSQEYQTYLTSDLSATLPPGKVEFAVGLDLSREDSFVMPIREPLQTYPAVELLRQLRGGVFGHMEVGFAALDSRRALLMAF